ncbi:MAG: hypothetical protein ACXQT4_02365 [Methanotrichaceae archaeon]
MRFRLILIVLILIMAVAAAHPNERCGVVRNVIDGCTLVVDGFGTVHLADVNCPPMGTANGVHSREYSMERLLNVQVFLDVDNNTGQTCVVYLYGGKGGPKLSPCFNRMIVDAGYAWVSDDPNNEFDPDNWWNTSR